MITKDSKMNRSDIPIEGSIERGRVSRIEPYGAFVQLDRYSKRGLVHISRLTTYKVERVEDVVSIDDNVWVKVLEVQEDGPHLKISLSMKDASQDGTAQDLEQGNQESDNRRKDLEQSLNSTIGMGIALDPMAGMSGGGSNRLVLKNAKSDTRVFNGYALVDDTEGEPEPTSLPNESGTAAVGSTGVAVVRPMGRGRGTTLPAWMTQKAVASATNKSDDDGDSFHSKGSKKAARRKKRKHKEKRKHGKKKTHRHRRDDRKRRRRSDSDDSYDRHRRSSSHREDRKHRSRKHSISSYDSGGSGSDSREGGRFANLEEAKELIAKLEEKKRHKK